MNISIEQADRLFTEANDWTLGKTQFISAESEIRRLAKEIFHQDNISTMQYVCSEIFRVLAEDAHDNWC